MFRKKKPKGNAKDDLPKFTTHQTGEVGSHPGYTHMYDAPNQGSGFVTGHGPTGPQHPPLSPGSHLKVAIKGSLVESKEVFLGHTSGFFVHTPKEPPVEPGVIVYDPTGSMIDVNVSLMQPGLYKCDFTPFKKGVHRIMVCYGQMNVPDSPMNVTAVEPRQSRASSTRSSGQNPSAESDSVATRTVSGSCMSVSKPALPRKPTMDKRESRRGSDNQAAFSMDALDMISDDVRSGLEHVLLNVTEFKQGRVLGKGEFGTVFEVRVRDREKGAIIAAAKNIKGAEKGATKEQLEEFLREAVLMYNFRHPNVLELLGVVFKDNSPYLLFPVMAKGNLRKHLIKMKGEIETKQLINYGLHVAQGMEYIVSLKFVHRDIAARNCLLSAEDVVKISDFGLARDNFQENYVMVNKNKRLPIKWMAPEILTTWTYSSETDVWSYGVLLWEIFAFGQDPYEHMDDYKMLLMSIKAGKTLDQPQAAPTSVYDIMRDCWNLNAEKRPTFTQICEGLKESLVDTDLSYGNLN